MTLSSILRLFLCLFFLVLLIVTMIIRTFNQESLRFNMKALLNKVLTLDVSAQHDDIVDRVRAQIITNTRCGLGLCPENCLDYCTYHNDGFVTITVLPGKAEPRFVQWIGNQFHHRLIILYSEKVNGADETKSILFRSHENGSMVNETCKLQPGAVIDSIFTSKKADKVIFRDMVHCNLYVTTNGGDTWDNYTYFDYERCLQFSPSIIQFTPSIIQFSDNNESYLFAIDNTSHSLYVSTQLGRNGSWMKLSTKVEAAYWTQLKDGQSFDDPTAIYFTESSVQPGSYKIKKAVFPYRNSSTCKLFQDIEEVTHFKLVYEYIFVIKNSANLFVSYMRQPFVQARFIPAMGKNDKNEQYSVVDASEGQVLLAVFKDDETADLYISDEWGTNYSLSLRNIITNNFKWNSGIESFDFYMVKGTAGTYIANVAKVGSQPLDQNTVISFNKGAKWSLVTAPRLDSLKKLECYYPDCSLHLDMHNSGIVSKESAVGMIMARGTFVNQSAGLYLSYDGGFSWIELFKTDGKNATYLFDILDNGSTILVVNKSESARQFMISCDTGFTWQYYDIYTHDLNIFGLHTEMSDTASLSTLYGYIEYPYQRYVILNLNMSQFNISECKYDCDYITWMPSDGRIGDRCVLGKKITFYKRKPGHCCRNKPKYWMLTDTAECNCTMEDFGCDVGFEHIDYNSPCTPVDSYNFAPSIYNCGYRKIPGDECFATRNSYFYNELQPCSSRIFGLYVNATPSPAVVDQPITFIVIVNGRHQLESKYYFVYGDGSHDISTANIVKHSYNISGYFSVEVIVSTATVNSSTTIGVFVENKIVDADVLVLHLNSSYLFAVTTQYKSVETDYYRSTNYRWNLTSDHEEILTINTSSPWLSYEFKYGVYYHYDLLVYNAVSSVFKQGNFSVKDEKAILSIISGPECALVNSTVKFDGHVDLLMPNNIIYRWIIINHNDGTVFKNFTGNNATLYVVFDRTGIYEITMQGLGSKSHDVSFNASTTITITAMYNFQLLATPSIVAVNQPVVLSVTKVSNMENFIYLFLFGDKQPSVQTSNSSTVYSYSVSGSYQASVTIEGIGKSVHFETVIIVQDTINTICVNTYVKSSTVTYVVIIDCGASSDHTYGTIQYIWDFNNGKNITTSLTTIITTYQFTGVYNFSLLASNNVSQKSYTGQIYVDTEPDHKNVQIIITGPRFALVNVTVIFSIYSKIPVILNLMHNWIIIDQKTNKVYGNKESNKFVNKFFKPSNYKVFASVSYNGSLFSSSHIISVESNLSYIKVDCPPIIEVARQTSIFIHLYDIHNDSYGEFVNISITSDTQSIILQYVKSPIIVKTYLSYSVNNIYTVDVLANNHVSEASTNFSVEVVRTNTTLLLEFSVVALSQVNVSYETTSWRKQFSDVIDTSLTNEISLLDWQLIVTAGSVRDFLEMFVDILPMSSSLTALANATMIANQLMNVIKSNYKFTLPNSSSCISVSNAIIVGLQQKTEGPTKGILQKNDDHALRLGTGIGVPVLLVIIISILIGIIYYRRNHQRKQYGHLSLSYNVERDIDLDGNDEITIWTRTT